MKKVTINVTTLKHETLDGKGKEIHYLILGDDAQKVIINVGIKTIKNVQTLMEQTVEEKPILNPIPKHGK